MNGNEVINLGSYNYLGMSGHPETQAAAIEAIKKYGTSASGSRVLAGEKTLYIEFEKTIAKWKHTDDAIVLTGGYATNLTFIGNFCGEGVSYTVRCTLAQFNCAGLSVIKGREQGFPA